MNGPYPLIAAKVRTPPRRHLLLRRQRLVDFCHESIQNKLILVAADAGYGKTSLLIDYAHDTDLPVCWYSLDAHDARPLTFIEYLVAAIRQRFPAFGKRTIEMLRSYTGPPENVEPFVRLLIHEMNESIGHYFVLVLDDYHEVLDSEAVNALVDGLLRWLPEQCHLILASRGIPRRLTLTRLAARRQVVGLGAPDLRFTPDEITQLLGTLQVELSKSQIQTLAERSEGWITGILLAAQTDWQGTSRGLIEMSGASGGVFDYMAEEILDRQHPEIRRFLLGSALFREMTPFLCDALLDIHNSARILRELQESNLFIHTRDNEGIWYQYHGLFREFLNARFERDDPTSYRALRLKQAELMAYSGQWATAIESFFSARAHDRAADAIEMIVQETFDSGDRVLLRTWLDVLPDAILAEHPRLLLFRARVATETGDLAGAAQMVDRAYRAYTVLEDVVGAARALIQRGVIQRFRGRTQDAISTCQQALEIAGRSDALTTTLAHHHIGICYAMQGVSDRAEEQMRQGLTHAKRQGDDINAAYIANDLGSVAVLRGNMLAARQSYHEALMYWRKIGNMSALASTLQSLGVLHHHLGQYAEAYSRLQEGYNKAIQARDSRIEAYALASQGDLYLDTAQYDKALEAYQQALDVASETQLSHLITYTLDAMGNAYRITGDFARARQVLTEALDQAQASSQLHQVGVIQVSLGALALAEAHLDEANTLLDAGLARILESDTKRDAARAHMLVACARLMRGDRGDVQEHVDRVVELCREMSSHQILVAQGGTIQPVIRFVIEHGEGRLDWSRVRTEIEQLASGWSAFEDRGPRYPLEILGLDGGRVLWHGEVVTNWESNTARAMLFLLVSYPEGMTRDRIIEMLWPDTARSRGQGTFHSTLYRLRAALSKDAVVHRDGGYRINPTIAYRYDVDEFLDLCEQAEADTEQAHVARRRAIALYRGSFFDVGDGEWVVALRERLYLSMMALLLAEGQHMAQENQLLDAAAHYGRAISLDSYDERAHRGVMWCRASMGDRTGALRQFQECTRILDEELGVPPSEDTLQMHRDILSEDLSPEPF